MSVLETVIVPAMNQITTIKNTTQAQAMLYAIGLQESAFKNRYQLLSSGRKGPARGLFQFEVAGVTGVLSHNSSAKLAKEIAYMHVGSINIYAIWASLEYDDILACKFARLLLFTDPKTLPVCELSSEKASEELYLRTWRPGKPSSVRWKKSWASAVQKIKGIKDGSN